MVYGTGSLGQFIQVAPKSRCFIAAAVYSEDSMEIRVPREWRDGRMNSVLGRLFARTCLILSPPIAKILKRKPVLQEPVRAVLKGIVSLIFLRSLIEAGGTRSLPISPGFRFG